MEHVRKSAGRSIHASESGVIRSRL
jgi:hypothetical protein